MEKSKKNVIPFAVAIILGIVSIITVNKYISEKTEVPAAKNARILIAKKSISLGKTISIEDLGTKIIPLSAVSEVNITLPMSETHRALEEISAKKAMVAGRISTRSIPADDPIFWSDFRKPQTSRLANKVPGDMRAVTIPVDSIGSVGFNIVPGDHIDILATSQSGCGDMGKALTTNPQTLRNLADANQQSLKKEKEEPSTYIIMQDVNVLAVAQDFNTYVTSDSRKSTYSNITLEVTIDEALLLTHARSQTKLSCVLRSPASINRIPSKELFPVDCTSLKKHYIYKFDKERAERLMKQNKKLIKKSPNPPSPQKIKKTVPETPGKGKETKK